MHTFCVYIRYQHNKNFAFFTSTREYGLNDADLQQSWGKHYFYHTESISMLNTLKLQIKIYPGNKTYFYDVEMLSGVCTQILKIMIFSKFMQFSIMFIPLFMNIIEIKCKFNV